MKIQIKINHIGACQQESQGEAIYDGVSLFTFGFSYDPSRKLKNFQAWMDSDTGEWEGDFFTQLHQSDLFQKELNKKAWKAYTESVYFNPNLFE